MVKDQRKNERQYSIMQSLMHDGAWFRFPFALLKIMSRDEAIVLSFLANHSFKVKCHERKGWFFCKMKDICEKLNMSEYTQTRVIAILRQNGFIKVDKYGMPARRWIFICWEEIEEKLNETEAFGKLWAPEENDDWSSNEDEEDKPVEFDDDEVDLVP